MMRGKTIKKIICIMCFLSFIVNTTLCLAADIDYRFMHNDHDTLLIGEVKKNTAEYIIVKAHSHIKSTRSLDNKRNQLTPKNVVIIKDDNIESMNLSVGEYIVASLNKRGNLYECAWGIYRVDTTDYKTLRVNTSSDSKSVMYTDFINSGGKYNQYSSFNGTITRNYQGIETIIYVSDGAGANYYIDKLQKENLSFDSPQEIPRDRTILIIIVIISLCAVGVFLFFVVTSK